MTTTSKRESLLGDLASEAEYRQYAMGDLIFEEGSASNEMFLVMEGTVEFSKLLENGQRITVNKAGEGTYFGEIGVLTHQNRTLRAVAASACEVAVLNESLLSNTFRKIPSPVEAIIHNLIRHLNNTTNHYITEVVQKEKLAVVGKMANSIVHDFKNPFATISMSAQMLERSVKDPKAITYCQRIRNQVERMTGMANELCDFAKGNTTQLDLKPTSILAVVEEFKQLNTPFLERENIQFVWGINDASLLIEGGKILRVLQNLIGNAVQALREQGGCIQVLGQAKDADGIYEILVCDNGPGIPEEIRDRLFDPFVTSGKHNGTGLGTSIVKTFVEAHKGRISFVTETGKGTTFTIQLPLAV
jgi:signal transduction histidine kinase